MNAQREYRVYPTNGRARTFAYGSNAQRFAERLFAKQNPNILDNNPVEIVIGSGSDYRVWARLTVAGWNYPESYHTSTDADVFAAVDCPRCGQLAGEPCRTVPEGNVRQYAHLQRYESRS